MENTEYNGYFFNEEGQVFNEKGLLLKPHLNNNLLKIYQRKKRTVIKDIIAKLFVPNPMNHKFTQTIDGDPTNVCKDNIEWVAYPKKIKNKSGFGLSHYKSNLTREKVILIKKLLKEGEITQKEIAKRVGCTQSRVTYIKTGVLYSDVE